MSHLACNEHQLRVLVVSENTTMHRMDGSPCKSEWLTIGKQFVRREDVQNSVRAYDKQNS